VPTIRRYVDAGVKTSHAARNLRAAIFRQVSAGLSGAALREAIAVAVHLEDVAWWVMRSSKAPVRRSNPKVSVHFVERKVAGDQSGAAFLALRDKFEQ
jgi:hypothetical protein